jgi:hypothetical protein
VPSSPTRSCPRSLFQKRQFAPKLMRLWESTWSSSPPQITWLAALTLSWEQRKRRQAQEWQNTARQPMATPGSVRGSLGRGPLQGQPHLATKRCLQRVSFQRAIACNAQRQSWQIWHSRQQRTCDLQIPLSPQVSESLSPPHNRINRLPGGTGAPGPPVARLCYIEM